jgi:hypothetical protein
VGCVAGAFLLYRDVIEHDAEISQAIAADRKPGKPGHDPGERRFTAAIDLVKAGQVEGGRIALYKLLQQFPKSPTCIEARRIIGEMNMDDLYRLDASGGKVDYIVQPRDALLGIVGRHHTTLEAISRINSLTSTNLKPGEHLFVIPMEFELVMDVKQRSLVVLRSGRFFKQYDVRQVKLPPTIRVPAELKVTAKSALLKGKLANPVSADYVDAEKQFVASRGVNTLSLVLQAARDGQPSEALSAITLAHEDMEELYPLLRTGSKFSLVQTSL